MNMKVMKKALEKIPLQMPCALVAPYQFAQGSVGDMVPIHDLEAGSGGMSEPSCNSVGERSKPAGQPWN